MTLDAYTRVFRDKAAENLAVAASSLGDGHSNAAVSRAYYAVYQAMVAVLHHRNGYRAPGAGNHKEVLITFVTWALNEKLCTRPLLDSIAMMKNERIKADYKPTAVQAVTASFVVAKAQELWDQIDRRFGAPEP